MFEFAAPLGALSQKRSLSLTCFVFADQNVNSGKFKHFKYSENVKFSGTNSVDSILIMYDTNSIVGAKPATLQMLVVAAIER